MIIPTSGCHTDSPFGDLVGSLPLPTHPRSAPSRSTLQTLATFPPNSNPLDKYASFSFSAPIQESFSLMARSRGLFHQCSQKSAGTSDGLYESRGGNVYLKVCCFGGGMGATGVNATFFSRAFSSARTSLAPLAIPTVNRVDKCKYPNIQITRIFKFQYKCRQT